MKDMIEICGGIDGEYGEIIIGGPHTGLPEDIDQSVITKVSGGAVVTMELPEYKGPVGLLVCACAGDEDRLKDIASKMRAEVVAITKCKMWWKLKALINVKLQGSVQVKQALLCI